MQRKSSYFTQNDTSRDLTGNLITKQCNDCANICTVENKNKIFKQGANSAS